MEWIVEWIVEDGNHRLAAAFYREDDRIEVSIGGDIDYAEEVLGIEGLGDALASLDQPGLLDARTE